MHCRGTLIRFYATTTVVRFLLCYKPGFSFKVMPHTVSKIKSLRVLVWLSGDRDLPDGTACGAHKRARID